MSHQQSEAKHEGVLPGTVVRICKNCQDTMGIAWMEMGPQFATIEYHCKECGATETVRSAQTDSSFPSSRN
jgi:hypothetical protein